MQIIQEAKKRKAEIEKELVLINRLLELYETGYHTDPVDGNLTLGEAGRLGIISVRTNNTVIEHPAFHGRKRDEIKLNELRPLLEQSQGDFLKLPNFGRKSLNELKALVERLTA